MDRLSHNHRFIACFGPLKLSFSKITGVGNEIEVTPVNEGGVNHGVTLLHSPKKSPGRLIFEHGSGILNPMNTVLEASRLGYYLSMPGLIVTYDAAGFQRAYAYSGGTAVKWSLSSFDAQSGDILIDTVEVLHNGIYEIPI